MLTRFASAADTFCDSSGAPELKLVSQFFDHPLFIKAFAQLGKKYMAQERFDHYLFSYHGLPEHQIHKSSCDNYSYQSQCFETTRLLAQALGIKKEDYTEEFNNEIINLMFREWKNEFNNQL